MPPPAGHPNVLVLTGGHPYEAGAFFAVFEAIVPGRWTHLAQPGAAEKGSSFMLTDELYMFPVLESQVVPLLRTRFPMDDASQFYSTDLAIRGTLNSNAGWTHPAGSDLVGWVKNAGNSPVAYLQFGDGPVTFADPSFQRVLSNAITWAASTVAHDWARARNIHASSGQTP